MSNRESNKWVVLVLVCFAQFMVVLDATIVNVALPSIQTDLGLSEANLQWIVNAYTLVFGGFLLLGGRAGDLIGRKRLFLGGIVVFTVASLLNALSRASAPRSSRPPRSRSSRPRSKRAPSAPARLASGPRSRSAARRSAWFSAACSPSCSPGRGSSSSTCRSAS
jgi:MFS family permease